jgi:hypothetical protein
MFLFHPLLLNFSRLYHYLYYQNHPALRDKTVQHNATKTANGAGVGVEGNQLNLAYADTKEQQLRLDRRPGRGRPRPGADRQVLESARQRLVPEGQGRPGHRADQGHGRGRAVLGLDLERHGLLWEVAKANLTGTEPKVGEVRKLDL